MLQAVGELPKSGMERPLERCALVLRERFLGNEKRGDLAFGDLDVRKAGDRLGIIETKLLRMIVDRQAEPVAHEIDIALNRLGRDLELSRDLLAVRKLPCLQGAVEPH